MWARLAVHIRTEHLHLFPAIARRVNAAERAIDRLRADHDFFMRELAQAIAILREFPQGIVTANDEEPICSSLIRPLPIANFRHVLTVLPDVTFVLVTFVTHLLD